MLPGDVLAKLEAMDDYDRMLAFDRIGKDHRMSAAEVEAHYNAWKSGGSVPRSSRKQNRGPVYHLDRLQTTFKTPLATVLPTTPARKGALVNHRLNRRSCARCATLHWAFLLRVQSR